ncbi:type II CAAX prenyl endopeptidase Rce1 family protein [Actinoplanes sp. NPDC049265]|uniref:CPBP family glutamic-type intramembrane protease n=1 Tax=Actinoplanes sp. NPDC049265 TaxID=3363902 RepID=UPI003723B656
MAIVYPAGFCANVTALLMGAPGFSRARSLGGSLAGFVIGYAVVVAVVALVRPHQMVAWNWPASPLLLMLAPVAGLACIALEYAVGVVIVYVRTGRLVTRAAIHSSYADFRRVHAKDVAAVLALVAGEELVLRQFLYSVLVTDLGVVVWAAIGLCAMAYAANHLSFGAASALAKLPSGLLYTWLFWASGMSLAVVIIAHATQNLTLLGLSRRPLWTPESGTRSGGRRTREVSDTRWP